MHLHMSLHSYWDFLEPMLFLGIGLYVHMNKIYSNPNADEELEPNAASIIFVTSLLCGCTKVRPNWPCCIKSSLREIQFVIELLASLSLVDTGLREMWLPLLKFTKFSLKNLAEYLKMAEIDYLSNFADWSYSDGFYIFRMILALIFMAVMSRSINLYALVKDTISILTTQENKCIPKRRNQTKRDSSKR